MLTYWADQCYLSQVRVLRQEHCRIIIAPHERLRWACIHIECPLLGGGCE